MVANWGMSSPNLSVHSRPASTNRALFLVLLTTVLMLGATGPAQAGLLDRWRAARGTDAAQLDEAEAGERPGSAGSQAVSLPPGARQDLNVAYGPDERNRLDVYIPAEAKSAPILLFVHGGAWIFGDKSMGRGVSNKVARWLPKGTIVVSANYRMPKPPDPAKQAEDVAQALAFVQENAPRWGGDGSRVLLMGHSAGAHLVSVVTADEALRKRHHVRDWLGTVSLDSAAMDVVALMEESHPRLYDRVFGDDPKHWRAVSPIHLVSGPVKPMLLVCSSRRDTSCQRSEAFAAAVKQHGGQAKVVPVDLGHGDLNSTLGTPGAYTEQVEAFMHQLGLP